MPSPTATRRLRALAIVAAFVVTVVVVAFVYRSITVAAQRRADQQHVAEQLSKISDAIRAYASTNRGSYPRTVAPLPATPPSPATARFDQ